MQHKLFKMFKQIERKIIYIHIYTHMYTYALDIQLL